MQIITVFNLLNKVKLKQQVELQAFMKRRLTEFLSYLKIGQLKFEENIGVSRGYVNKIGDNITVKTLDKIIKVYPELNINWLKTGEGEMLKTAKKVQFQSNFTPVEEGHYMWVEYADLKASAGKLGGGDIDNLDDTRKRLVPKEFDNGNFLIIRIDGDSMADGTDRSLKDGEEVLICERQDYKIDELPIKKSLFVITSREGNVIKQISEVNMEDKYIVCHSFNPAYKDFKISFDDIYQIFIVCKKTQSQITLV